MNNTFSFKKGENYISNKLKMKYLKKYGFKEETYNTNIITGWCNNQKNAILKTNLYKNDPLSNKLYLWKLLQTESYIPKTTSIKNGRWTTNIFSSDDFYYVKDPEKDAGNGIVFKKTIEEIEKYSRNHPNKELIIQKRIDNPYCYEGKKIDMRVYCVLCSNKKKLWVRIYKEAICRKNPYIYDLSKHETELTNTTVNKNKTDYESCIIYLSRNNELYNVLMPKIVKIIYKLFNKYTHIYNKYKDNIMTLLYGIDFLVTKKKECFLLEINRSPSIHYTNFHNKIIETLVKNCYKPLLLKSKLLKSSLYYDIEL